MMRAITIACAAATSASAAEFVGGVDTLHRVAFNASGVAQILPAQHYTNLIVWLPFAYDSDGVYYDNSANGYNGAQTNAAARPTSTGGFITFDGTNDLVDLPTNCVSTNVITIAFWARGTTDVLSIIFSATQSTAASNFFQVFLGGNASGTLTNELLTFSKFTNNQASYVCAYCTTNRGDLLDNAWHHVALVFSNAGASVYIDATNQPLVTGLGSNDGVLFRGINAVDSVLLGMRKLSGAYTLPFRGSIADFKLLRSAWTTNDAVLDMLRRPSP